MKLTEKKLSRDEKFCGKIIDVHVDQVELENGEVTFREVVDHPGGVCVVAITDKDEVLMVRQFRYPYGQILREIPAGKLERGEDPFEAVKREQMEETGTGAEEYVYLGDLYPTPGYCSEIIRIWACRVSTYGEPDPDDDEFLEVDRVPMEQAVAEIMENKIRDSKTQIGILKAYALMKQGKL